MLQTNRITNFSFFERPNIILISTDLTEHKLYCDKFLAKFDMEFFYFIRRNL